MRCFSAILIFLAPLTARAQAEIFTPQHIAKLRIVTEAVMSPDGKKVAYTLAVPRDLAKEKDGLAWTELHTVDMEGNSKPLITGPVNIAKISWTRDGKEIALLAKFPKDSARCLYAIGAGGGKTRKLVTHPTDIQEYSFSGDGSEVAFLAAEPPTPARKKQREFGFIQEVFEEDLPFVRAYVYPVGNQSEPDAKPELIRLEGSASELHFHPTKRQIAVALAPTPTVDDFRTRRKLYVVEIDGGRATKVDYSFGKIGQVAWSPDGKALAFIGSGSPNDPKESGLYCMDILGPAHLRLKLKLFDNIVPGLAPFESFRWKNPIEFWSIGRRPFGNGYSYHWVEDGKLVHRSPIGRPNSAMLRSITVSTDGESVAFLGDRPTHPPEVYVANAKTMEARRLTDSNPQLKNMLFAKQEIVQYPAEDGRGVMVGILVRPLDEIKGRRHPLIVSVHDGPAAHCSNGWVTSCTEPGQVAAARGMAVFYPNYRGSTTWDSSFALAGQKDAGGKEILDVIDGVNHLVDIGLVDKKKVGITGAGYGGYMTACCATTYSDRFAAAVMFAGISDWISCIGSTDNPHEQYLAHHRQWLWEDWDYFANASPIKHLKLAKTPLLIAHGKADAHNTSSQSLELYRHLKTRGQAPVRLVLYPDEGHVLGRQASRLDYNMRLLQWMEHYLKGPGGNAPPTKIDYGIKE